jgi:hypothetical protein
MGPPPADALLGPSLDETFGKDTQA